MATNYNMPQTNTTPQTNIATTNVALNNNTVANASHSFTVTKAVMQGFKSEMDNSEEAQALARRRLRGHLDLASLIVTPSQYTYAYEQAKQYGQSMIDYSMQNGTLGNYMQEAKTLRDDLNQVGTLGNLSLNDVRQSSAKMFRDSTLSGNLVLHTANGTVENTVTSASAILGNSQSSIVSRIGEFSEKTNHMDYLQLHVSKPAANQNTLNALVELRSSNYACLDRKLDISRRAGICFRGTKEDFDNIFNSGKFSKTELDEMQKAITANGVVDENSIGASPMLANAQARAKQKVATSAFDDTQTKGICTIRMGYRTTKGIYKVGSKAKYWNNEHKYNKAVKNLEKKIGKGVGRGEDVSALKKNLEKAREQQAKAKELRQAKKDFDRATKGLSKTEKKKAFTRLKMEDRALKGKNTSRLVKKYSKLDDKLKKLKNKARNKVANKALGKISAKLLAAKAKMAAMKQALGAALKSALSAVLPYVGIALGVLFLFLLLIGLVVSLILVVYVFFFGTGDEDSDKPPFAEVQNHMNTFEVEERTGKLGLIMGEEDTVTDSIYTDIGDVFKRKYTFDFNVIDEYGKPANICNCMQSLSLYRIYYTIEDTDAGDTEGEDPDAEETETEETMEKEVYMTKRYKQKMELAFDRTHYLISYNDGSKMLLKDFIDSPNPAYYHITGGLLDGPAEVIAGAADGEKYTGSNYGVYHKPGMGCDNFYVGNLHGTVTKKSTESYDYASETGCDNYKTEEKNVYKDNEREEDIDYNADYGIDVTKTSLKKLSEADINSLLTKIEGVVKTLENASPTCVERYKEGLVQKFSALETFVREKDEKKKIDPYLYKNGFVFDAMQLSTTEKDRLKKYKSSIFKDGKWNEDELETAYKRYLILRWMEEREAKKTVQEKVLDYVEYTYSCKGHCLGHVNVECTIETITDVKNIATKENAILEDAYGNAIVYDELDKDSKETLEALIGTYEEGYATGIGNWATFDVFFAGGQNILTASEMDEIVADVKKANGGNLSAKKEAVLRQALKGCGMFLYDMKEHGKGSEFRDSPGGTTDCSGFASWIFNNLPQYYPDGLGKGVFGSPGRKVYTTLGFINNMKTVERNVSIDALDGVTFLIKNKNTYDTKKKEWSGDKTSNHILLYLGYRIDENGDKCYMIVDNTSGVGASYREVKDATGLNKYQYMLPITN